jgi:hypothetical protein
VSSLAIDCDHVAGWLFRLLTAHQTCLLEVCRGRDYTVGAVVSPRYVYENRRFLAAENDYAK